MADCGTELRTVAAAPDGKPADATTLLIITANGYLQLSFAQLWAVLNELYAGIEHNHNLQDLEDVSGIAADGQILMFDAETGKAAWVTPDYMPSGSNFDNTYVKISPINKTYTEDSSFEIPTGRMMMDIVVIPTEDLASFSVGTGPGGQDIMPAIPIGANTAETFTLKLYANGARTVWFNGITAETNVKIYLW